MQALLGLQAGQIIMVILRAINWWQLDHPDKTKEDAKAWVAEQWTGPTRAKWEADVPPPIVKGNKKKTAKRQGEKGGP